MGERPAVTAGTYVSFGGRRGRVDMVVSSGVVPGVPAELAGTPEAPAARVAVWQEKDGGWAPSSELIAAPVADLQPIPPMVSAPDSIEAQLVALHAAHVALAKEADAPTYCSPSAQAVKEVFERGRQSWPGEEKTTLDAESWGLARVAAFFNLSAGRRRDGYIRDTDLLPQGHPCGSDQLGVPFPLMSPPGAESPPRT